MDNFEWSEGYSIKFGLYHIDRHTMNRTPKMSADWYRNFLTNSSIIADTNFSLKKKDVSGIQSE
ncbi:putative beta-glucosidase 15 [Phtheirospermum japonicum]|uniref:Putative beta-glucosidase 15 n=1 Tax=Phtheirospermum japonicum TaxID=374723 RepID=A0A830B1N7_9LAMI|nr:putative beta-glucosidase 15 [Phtheirospermum japonicum]